jgi:hypothetical protein
MQSNRRLALTTGLLFLTATAAILLATAIEQPVLNGTDWLARILGNATQLSAAGLLEFIAAGASAAIAISLYPLLREWSVGLALGAVAFRTIEAVMYTLGAVGLLSVLTVGDQITIASGTDRLAFQAVGASLLALRQEAILAGVFAFGIGALMYYCIFYRSRLVPRWLSAWGIGGAMLMLVACLLALFSQSPVTSYTMLAAPIAVQEVVLAVWLIAMGFSASAQQSRTAAATSAD